VPEEPPPVANWLGRGSDIGDSGGTVDPGSAVDGEVGVVVAGAPAGGTSPPDGVDDDDVEGTDDVDGAAGAAGGAGTLRRLEGKLVLGAEGLELGATDVEPAEERACANAASGSSATRAMAATKRGVGVSIAIHHGCVL
jgi:hypothetical protein